MNKARCKICNSVVESKFRHDFVTCEGGHFFLDGGSDYIRWGFLQPEVTQNDIEWLNE